MRPYGQHVLCLDISLPPRLRVQRLGYSDTFLTWALGWLYWGRGSMNLVPACHLDDVAKGVWGGKSYGQPPWGKVSDPEAVLVQPARSSSSATCKQGI